MPGIFNRAIFNNAIFNTAEVEEAADVVVTGGFEPRKRRRDEELIGIHADESAAARAARIERERIALGIIKPEATEQAEAVHPQPLPDFDLGDEPEEYEVKVPPPPLSDSAIGRPLTPQEIEELRRLLARAAEEEDIALLLLAIAS